MERLYFDGDCPTCAGWVRWILARESAGGDLRFAPLGGTTFAARVPPERRIGLVGTLVLETEDGRLLVRSDAVIHILRRIGRRKTASALAILPRFLRDLGYRAYARTLRRDGCSVGDRPPADRFDP